MQLVALEKAGCERIYTDKASGKSHRNPGLKRAIRALSPGDSLVAWSLDRLGRTMKGLIDLAYLLNHKQINLQFLIEQIDTRTSTGRYIYNIKAATAVLELERNIERTLAGLAVARAAGRVGGRKRVMTSEKCCEAMKLLESGMSRKDIAVKFGVSTTSIYRHLPSSKNLTELYGNERHRSEQRKIVSPILIPSQKLK